MRPLASKSPIDTCTNSARFMAAENPSPPGVPGRRCPTPEAGNKAITTQTAAEAYGDGRAERAPSAPVAPKFRLA